MMTAYFASPHNTYSPHMCTKQISQTWSVKTMTYLIITWAFSSGPLTGSKSLSLSDFLSLLRLTNAANILSFGTAGPPVPQTRPQWWLAPFISVSISLHSRWKWTIGVNTEPWTDVHWVINPPSARCLGRSCQEEKIKSQNPKQKFCNHKLWLYRPRAKIKSLCMEEFSWG